MEAAEGGITFIVAITEGVPAHDEAWFYNKLKRDFPQVQLLGPNCPGIISPGKCNIGITAGHIAQEPTPGARDGRHREPLGHPHLPGPLRAQAQRHRRVDLRRHRRRPGARHHASSTASSAFEADTETDAVMMIGEIGGSAEEEAADFIKASMSKPVVSLHRRRHRASRARRWATPAPSSPAARAPPRPRWTPCSAAGAEVGMNPTEAGQLMVEVVKNLA